MKYGIQKTSLIFILICLPHCGLFAQKKIILDGRQKKSLADSIAVNPLYCFAGNKTIDYKLGTKFEPPFDDTITFLSMFILRTASGNANSISGMNAGDTVAFRFSQNHEDSIRMNGIYPCATVSRYENKIQAADDPVMKFRRDSALLAQKEKAEEMHAKFPATITVDGTEYFFLRFYPIYSVKRNDMPEAQWDSVALYGRKTKKTLRLNYIVVNSKHNIIAKGNMKYAKTGGKHRALCNEGKWRYYNDEGKFLFSKKYKIKKLPYRQHTKSRSGAGDAEETEILGYQPD